MRASYLLKWAILPAFILVMSTACPVTAQLPPPVEPGEPVPYPCPVDACADLFTDSNNDGVISPADDAVEDDPPGRVIQYNDDDDNSNGVADRIESGPIAGENDLAQITLCYRQSASPGSMLTLQAVSGADRIKVWTTPAKGSEVVLPNTYIVGMDQIPWRLYVEGVSPGEAVLELAFVDEEQGIACEDTIVMTVVHVTLTQVKFDYSSGVSTDLTATVLTDVTANWATNELVGCYLYPDVNDSTDGSSYMIASNTQTTITVSYGNMLSHAQAGNKYAVAFQNDGQGLRKNYSTDVALPEWDTASYRNNPAAYLTNKQPVVWARLTVSPSTITSARIWATSSDLLGGLGEQIVNFTNGDSGFVRFTPANTTGNSVTRAFVYWHWKYKHVNGSGPAQLEAAVRLGHKSGPHKIYVLLNEPWSSPWLRYGTNRVWADALDKSCDWAGGATNIPAACAAVRGRIYTAPGAQYSGFSYYTAGPTTEPFMLTSFLAAWGDMIGYVNCYDCGKSLTTFANALGCSLSYKFSYPWGILNCFYLIGGYQWRNNLGEPPIMPEDEYRTGFNNHAFTGLGADLDAYIYDATFIIDGDDNPDYPPCTGMAINGIYGFDYIQAVIDNYPPSEPGWPGDYEFGVL